MYCKNCGNEIPNGQGVCPVCGTNNLVAQQPQQQIIVTQSAAKQGNGMATAGFVMSMLSLVFSFAFIFNLLGCIFSIVGLIKSKSLDGAGKGLSIAGLVVSLITLIPAILLINVIVAAIGSAGLMLI